MYVRAGPTDPPLGLVDLNVAEVDGGWCGRGGPFHPAQQDVHPGGQLPHRERLGEVVVRTDREPHQQIGLVVPGGEHQHRHRPDGLDPPAHLQAVEAGQHHVEDDEIRLSGAELLDRAGAVRRDLHREALGAESGGDRLGNGSFVLDHQYPALPHRP